MIFSTLVTFVAASLFDWASAIPQHRRHEHPVAQPAPYSSTHCYTWQAYHPPHTKPGTTWSTIYTSCTSSTVITVTKTSTPSPTTTTVTIKTTTTGPTNVLTQTDTATSTITDTATSTETDTTSTTTTSTSTSTVPTSDGFVPVQTSLPGSTYDGAGGPNPVTKKRSAALDLAIPALKGSDGQSKASYKQGVVCKKWVGHCKAKTVTDTTTTTAPTPTSTKTTTVTSTVIPSATTTITTTTSTTTTTTTTETDTITQTSTKSTSTTVYAACATANMADVYLGAAKIQDIAGGSPNQGFTYSNEDSAYDCCVSTFVNAGSTLEAWEYSTDTTCLSVFASTDAGDSCAAGQNSYTFTAEAEAGQTTSEIVGNGYCGIINSASIFT